MVSLILRILDFKKPDGSFDESFVTIQEQKNMYAFDDDHPRPANAVKPDADHLPWD
jgi:hypothetical protein